MTLFLSPVIVAVVLGPVGAVASGLGCLLLLGIVVFAADLLYGYWLTRGRRPVR